MRKTHWKTIRRWKERDAVQALEALAASGMTVRGFAEQHGVHAWRLYRWQRRLGTGAAREVPRFVAIEMAGAPESVSVERAEVVGGRPAAGVGSGDDFPATIEVVLEDHIRIRLRAEFEGDALRRAVQALRSC